MAENYLLHSTNPLEEKCLDLANHLIYICKVPLPLVYSMEDISANLIILLFESLTNYEIPDFLCSEDSSVEAHNVQAVIDTLSFDILGVSLSHITGENIISRDVEAVYNLLEVLEGLLLLIPSNDELVTKSTEAPSTSKSKESSKATYESPAYEKLKPSFSKPIKMKRYTKHKNKVTSSDVVQNSCLNYKSKNFGGSPKKVCLNSYKNSQVNSVCKDKKTGKENCVEKEILVSQYNKDPFAISRLQELKENIPQQEISSPNKLGFKRRKTLKLADAKKNKDSKYWGVEELHEKNLATKIKALLESKSSPPHRALQMKKSHLKDLRRPVQRAPLTPCRKSFLLPYDLRQRPTSYQRKLSTKKSTKSSKNDCNPGNSSPNRNEYHQLNSKIRSLSETIPKRLYSNSENSATSLKKKDESATTTDIAFVKNWMEEFPGLKLPKDVVNRTTKLYEQQLMNMHKQLKNSYLRKTKAYKQAEDASKKQFMISKLLEKDVDHSHHLNEVKQLKANENKLRFHFRNARMQSAKMKQYYDKFHLEMRKRMQKRNYSEEIIAENVFKEVLKIQNDQVQMLCEDVKHSDEVDAKRHKNYLDALENLYQNNFAALTETVANEKKNCAAQNDAHEQMMRKVKIDLNKNLQKEVHQMQKDILEAMQDTHFRELDAEQYKVQMGTKFS